MSNASTTPGSRPRKGIIAVAGLAAVGLAATALALGAGEAASPPRLAGAAGLSTFASCDDLAAWGRDASSAGGDGGWGGGEDDMATAEGGASFSESTPTAAPTSGRAEGGDSGGGARADEGSVGATNVDVEGVDELDLVDRLDGDRVLVASASRLAVVDLAAATVVTSVEVPYDAQVTYDAEEGIAWVVGHDDRGLTVERVAVDGDGLAVDGRWTTSGYLVDARRVGDQLHLVATEGFGHHDVGGGSDIVDGWAGPRPAAPGAPEDVVPFAGGPVPCDAVWHPTGPSDPVATLLVTLPARGALEPIRAAEVVGAGEQVHVTLDAAYLATPQWDGDETTTTIHRFDLATLAPTGSGRVEGRLLDQFSMSAASDHLRVAVTTGPDVVGVMPDIAVDGPARAPGGAPPLPEGRGDPRNEVVVLDIDGDLDVVGRTPRFGKPGESIHGIRFSGPVAYAVTFLTTDPFYVIDLATPTAPRILGEVELPGFSSYLHPLSDDLVVGFGPGADGRATAKLFDVSDPAAPRVADDLLLGDESAVVWDHHAFVDLGEGRFAVPASAWREVFPERCGPDEQAAAQAEARRLQGLLEEAWNEGDVEVDPSVTEPLERELDALHQEGCVYPGSVTDSSVVVVDTAGGRLAEEGRLTTDTAEPASRALPAGDGWALLAGPQIVVLDATGAERARLSLT